MSKESLPNFDKQKPFPTFQDLRMHVHDIMAKRLQQRIQETMVKTLEETRLGAYVEEIEPQVLGAVLEMNQKGYSTYSSGFYGEQGELQAIEGHFLLDDETKRKLIEKGVSISQSVSWKFKIEKQLGRAPAHFTEEDKTYTRLEFHPDRPNLTEIERHWKEIAALLPDKGTPAKPEWQRYPGDTNRLS